MTAQRAMSSLLGAAAAAAAAAAAINASAAQILERFMRRSTAAVNNTGRKLR
jgi:hypothetical protein